MLHIEEIVLHVPRFDVPTPPLSLVSQKVRVTQLLFWVAVAQ